MFGFGVSPSERHKFTGKERDAESGLDYFGARYHSSTMGRFSSPDPISYNLLRVVSPQRWNRYVYAVNNPLLFVDPDGRDAISVNLSQPAAGMGHQALIAVRLDGSATFGDFGPETPKSPAGRGRFFVRDLATKVAFDRVGLPTEASMQQLLKEVADLEKADPATMSFAYFKTTAAETQALTTYMETARRRQIEGDVPPYIVGFTDCGAFCSQGLRAAGIGDGARAATIPNIFQFFAVQSADASFSGKTGQRQVNRKGSKEEITSTFIPCPPGAAGSADCRGTAK